ncbi:hypothetical protein MMC06_003226 [Schaereria dolodes]|nr:hypothetical protein [Schaereria dolodes]
MAGISADASIIVPKVGSWLPDNHQVIHNWVSDLIKQVHENPDKPFHPIIQELKDLIENNSTIYMLISQMFEQIPNKPPYNDDPTGQPQVRDYHLMLKLFNEIMTRAPEYNGSELVGFPFNAILDWPMGTKAGYAAFLNDKLNIQLGKMLNEWAKFLSSSESCYVLSNDPVVGWFGKAAIASMPDFDNIFQCDPSARFYGFTSWDDFFTRQLKPNARPVDLADMDDVIVNACESAPFCLANDVKPRDRFWIKSQPYSLQDMLVGHLDDNFAPQFYGASMRSNVPDDSSFHGATVYQAFLSARSYHRWHSPVNGKVVETRLVPGTYYSETRPEGFDPAAPNDSQGYITAVATRALVYIEADNPKIGLMCFVAVGMAEVSTCDTTVKPGDSIKKGDEIGMFHFGGSTHCLAFRPGVNLKFDLQGQTPSVDATNININKAIAVVV